MISRNQIRQSTLQYLYAASQAHDELHPLDEGIWSIILECPTKKIVKLTSKALANVLTRGFEDRLRLFTTRAHQTIEILRDNALTLDIRDKLMDILAKEGEFQASLLQLRKLVAKNTTDERNELSVACRQLQDLNATLIPMRERLVASFSDFPSYKETAWAAMTAACRKMQEANLRIASITTNDATKIIPEVKAIREAQADLNLLTNEAKALSADIIRNLAQIDALIDSKLENYTPERIDAMDRNILRLSTYELLYRRDLATPIIVSEAIALATDYSNTEAPRFINGILVGIAKEIRPE